MRIRIHFRPQSRRGYALILSTIFSAIGLFILGSALQWTATNSKLIERNNQYFTSVAAAEAATEQIIAQLNYDFLNKGRAYVDNNLRNYTAIYPSLPAFTFMNTSARAIGTSIEQVSSTNVNNLDPRYPGLYGFASFYRIISNASEKNTRQLGVVGAVKQDVWLTSIPIFQWAAFSTGDLEINPGQDMVISGRVHSNSNIYFQPNGVKLTFQSDVTAVGKIIGDEKPGDPSKRTKGTSIFKEKQVSGSDSLSLPIGTNNTPDAVHAILEIPPKGEDPDSAIGRQRYYNNADLQVLLTDTGLVVRTPANNTVIENKIAKSFVNTELSFYDQREKKTIKGIEIDMAQLKSFLSSKNVKVTVDTIYVADTRTLVSGTEPGVRLINGETLPNQEGLNLGLTVATPNPLYVKGDYNVTLNGSGSSRNTTNTAYTVPASLVADAITILSSKWDDSKATGKVADRQATPTTVNAAFLAGNVETTDGYYSGGLENFPRFLESWGDANPFTYNGSMVMMFKSKTATGRWGSDNVYNAPKRNWAFDSNFKNYKKLPPETPGASRVYRKLWDVIAPNTTS